MASFFGHLLLLSAAGVALYRLWRSTRSTDRFLNVTIAAGFLARAFAGQLLFWISYERLPVARSLQQGDGLWFFAVDAFQYYPQALDAASRGVWGIITCSRGNAAVSFVQALATAVFLFGPVASAALILNLFCFLGMVLILVRWSAHHERARLAVRVAVAAVSLSPAFILWSLQPLKDTMFQFTVIAFIGSCAAWQRAWVTTGPASRKAVIASVMAAVMFVLSGIRWYFAFAVLVACVLFMLLVAIRTSRRVAAFAIALVVLFVLSRAFLVGGGPYIPDSIQGALTPRKNVGEMTALPLTLANHVEHARKGFEQSGGDTQIGLGGTFAPLDRAAAQQWPETPAPPNGVLANPHSTSGKAGTAEPKSPSVDDEKKTALPVLVTKLSPATLRPGVPASSSAPNTVHQESAQQHNASPSPAADGRTMTKAPLSHVQTPAHQPGASAPAAAHLSRPAQTAPAPTDAPLTTIGAPAPAPVTDSSTPEHQQREAKSVDNARPPVASPLTPHQKSAVARSRSGQTHIAETTPVEAGPSPAAVQSVRPVTIVPQQAVPAAAVREEADAQIGMPASRVGRVAAGTAAVLVPRAIGQSVGLFHIGGGRSLWWFADVDTLIFDLFTFAAFVLTARSRRFVWRNPIFWLVTALTLLIAIPLIYTVTNFGTLFRLREMIFLGVLLIPLAVAATPQKQPQPAVEEA